MHIHEQSAVCTLLYDNIPTRSLCPRWTSAPALLLSLSQAGIRGGTNQEDTHLVTWLVGQRFLRVSLSVFSQDGLDAYSWTWCY